MNASGSLPWVASQLDGLDAGRAGEGPADDAGDLWPISGMRELSDPAAIGLLGADITETALLGLTEKVARFAICLCAQRHAAGQGLERVEDKDQRLRWLIPAYVDFLEAGGRCRCSGSARPGGRRGCGCSRAAGWNGLELRDLDAEILWTALDIVPRESPGKFGIELIAQRHGIMIVEQDEMLADREIDPALEDLSVFDAARDGANVENEVEIGSGGGELVHDVSGFLYKVRWSQIAATRSEPIAGTVCLGKRRRALMQVKLRVNSRLGPAENRPSVAQPCATDAAHTTVGRGKLLGRSMFSSYAALTHSATRAGERTGEVPLPRKNRSRR